MIPGAGTTLEKTSSEPMKKEHEVTQEQKPQNEETIIRSLYHGAVVQNYLPLVLDDIGINDKTDEASVRISGNESSGVYSGNWVLVRKSLMYWITLPRKLSRLSFSKLYVGRSTTNNHGYLTAILKAEGVVGVMAGKQTELHLKIWAHSWKK